MLSTMQSKSLSEAAEHYSQAISADALAYLAGRGISEEVAGKYRLGTITDPIEGHQMYEGWISIPYFTALDICVGSSGSGGSGFSISLVVISPCGIGILVTSIFPHLLLDGI